jgi:lipoprotein-releasing system permease protein
MISMLVVAFITAAMICVMGAFNGIDDLVKKLFSNFDTPITIIPAEGRMFADSLLTDDQLRKIDGIRGVSRVIEEDAWLSFRDHNCVATVKGVDKDFEKYSPIDSMIYDGEFKLEDDSFFFALVGLGVRSELNMPIFEHAPTVMNINAPIRGRKLSRYKEEAFNREAVNVSGIFSVNAELDSKYIILPLGFTRNLFGMEKDISSIEIYLNNDEDAERIASEISAVIPKELAVQTRYQKNALVYQTNATEKWATFLILLFILILACFNIIASLTTLIIEKKNDIFVLSSVGAHYTSIERIFVYEGILINLIGAVIGTCLGIGACLAQQHFELIKMEGAMVDSYPVLIKWMDVVGIFLTVLIVGSIFSITLVRALMRRFAGNTMTTETPLVKS